MRQRASGHPVACELRRQELLQVVAGVWKYDSEYPLSGLDYESVRIQERKLPDYFSRSEFPSCGFRGFGAKIRRNR
jgi:hypothetical protein